MAKMKNVNGYFSLEFINMYENVKFVQSVSRTNRWIKDISDFFIKYYLHVNLSGLKRNKLQNVYEEILDSLPNV